MKKIINKIQITEKTSRLLDLGKYVFLVDKDMDKIEIKQIFKSYYNLTVTSVKTMNYYGKKRRRGSVVGKTSDFKKTIVMFDKNDDISFINDLIKG